MTLEQLEAEVERLREDLNEAEQLLMDARVAAAEFSVGDVVRARKRNNVWAPAIVREVQAESWSTWYVVSFARNNGEWSKALCRAFSDVRSVDRAGEAG